MVLPRTLLWLVALYGQPMEPSSCFGWLLSALQHNLATARFCAFSMDRTTLSVLRRWASLSATSLFKSVTIAVSWVPQPRQWQPIADNEPRAPLRQGQTQEPIRTLRSYHHAICSLLALPSATHLLTISADLVLAVEGRRVESPRYSGFDWRHGWSSAFYIVEEQSQGDTEL